jgi:hypothetical protein
MVLDKVRATKHPSHHMLDRVEAGLRDRHQVEAYIDVLFQTMRGQRYPSLRLLDRLHGFRAAEGRADEPFEIHVISLDAYSLDGVRRLEDQGVTDVVVGFRWPYSVGPDTQSLQEKLDLLRRYADDVIAKS